VFRGELTLAGSAPARCKGFRRGRCCLDGAGIRRV